jgi:imidazolonepropionase-like amidohydrolase
MRFCNGSAIAVAAALILGAQASGQESTYAFVNVNVLPMDHAGVVAGQTVVVRGGVITEVGPTPRVQVPDGATTIDGSGRYLMPGLAEMHAHVPPEASPPQDVLDDILFLYIANGITTIRGMLGQTYQIELADRLERGELLGPTFYVGAPSINGTSAPDPATAERLIRQHEAAGYDLQKIHPGVSRATWDRMAEVARQLDFTFGGHVPADVGLVHALETGMSTVDHLDGYVEAVASSRVAAQLAMGEDVPLADLVSGVDEAKLAEVVRLSRERGVYVVPTLYLWENLFGTTNADPFLNLPEMKYVSRAQKDAWRRQAAAGPRGEPQALEVFFALRKRILKELSDAGVSVLMGTDSPQMFNVPGFALHRELDEMAEAGLSSQRILESGTVSVGRYVRDHLGLDVSVGTVTPGARADLVLLGANPLDDLDNLTDRVGVMVRGRWVSRAEIDSGLARLAEKHAG